MWKFALRGRAGDKGNKGDFNYTDRGDISNYDMDLGTIVTNGVWQPLNISGIVGAGHRLVLISVFAAAETYGNTIEFRTHGNENNANIARLLTLVADGEHVADLWVWTDAAGIINYRCSDTAWDTLTFTVRGWVEPTA